MGLYNSKVFLSSLSSQWVGWSRRGLADGKAAAGWAINGRADLLAFIIIKAMPRKIYDEEYVNEKELKKGHTYISLKVDSGII